MSGVERGATRRAASQAERVSLGLSLLILVGLLSLLLYAHLARGTRPPVIEVRPHLDAIRNAGDAYYLPVTVSNTGDQTAEQILIQFSLATDTRPESNEFTVDFLAGGESERATVVFRNDPAAAELTTTFSFLEP